MYDQRKTILEIDEVKCTDQGYYQCKVWKNGEAEVSKEAWLTVIETNGNETVIEGNTATFTCILTDRISEVQLQNVIWWKDNNMIEPTDAKYIFKNETTYAKYTIQIYNVERKDKGYYQCKVHGEFSDKAWLTVFEITRQPPICELSKSVYEQCEMVYMTCITENKWPPDIIEFNEYLDDERPKTLNTTCQCGNVTHLWAISEEVQADPDLNTKIICKIFNYKISSDARYCNKSLVIQSSTTTDKIDDRVMDETATLDTEEVTVSKISTETTTGKQEEETTDDETTDNKTDDNADKYTCECNNGWIIFLLIIIIILCIILIVYFYCLFGKIKIPPQINPENNAIELSEINL
ncbi:uncharacterized protein [Antedon mediterranea]|uniref:uncharacterized protein n=1 Tax=Antedon mediterranea TaxID=105859 RepID=UPI003AF48178